MIFFKRRAVLSPDGRSTTFRNLGTGEKSMQIRDGVVEAIGHTPLIKLERASAATGCTILGKAEFMNPGGSVKDRAGPPDDPGGREARRAQARRARGRGHRRQHRHRPRARRQRARLSHADRHSRTPRARKRRTCCGSAAPSWSRCRRCPTPIPNNYQHVARRLADKLRKTEKNGVLFADQWNNRDNRLAHYLSTGPEIWERDQGKIDGFICSVGTGGTLAGVSIFLREKKKDIVIGVADPRGAAMYNLFSTRRGQEPPKAARSPKASGSAASRRSSTTSRSTRPI